MVLFYRSSCGSSKHPPHLPLPLNCWLRPLHLCDNDRGVRGRVSRGTFGKSRLVFLLFLLQEMTVDQATAAVSWHNLFEIPDFNYSNSSKGTPTQHLWADLLHLTHVATSFFSTLFKQRAQHTWVPRVCLLAPSSSVAWLRKNVYFKFSNTAQQKNFT